jgi:bacterioferritin
MPNRDDVKQLKMLTTGRNGELTAVLTYLYQHYILNESYSELSKALEQISLVEMTHYELLSEAIVDFGGDPNLTNGQGDIWTGRNIDTTKEVKKMLKNDIKSEEMAIVDYNRASKNTRNESLSELYLRIAKDEALHIVVLNYFLDMIQN